MKRIAPQQEFLQSCSNVCSRPILSQLAYSPGDFAALFEKSVTWGYRRVWVLDEFIYQRELILVLLPEMLFAKLSRLFLTMFGSKSHLYASRQRRGHHK